jgi:hypothetical protein
MTINKDKTKIIHFSNKNNQDHVVWRKGPSPGLGQAEQYGGV